MDVLDVCLCLAFVFIGFLVLSTNICSLVILRQHWDIFEEVPRFLYRFIGVIDLIGGLSGCIYYIFYLAERDCQRFYVNRALSGGFYFGFLFSAILISCLNIDRYIAISKPLRYTTLVTIRSAIYCLAVLSLSSAIFFVLAFVPGSPVYKITNGVGCINGTIVFMKLTPSEVATICTLYSFCVVPIYMGISLNLISMRIATRQARAIAAIAAVPRVVDGNDMGQRRVDFKGIKTILLISLVNLISWVPTIVRLFVTVSSVQLISGKTTDVLLAMLTLVNSWSNAFIFARTNAAYRRAAKDSFRSICRR